MDNLEILVVEDTATQAEQLKMLLESRGYNVTVAKDGEEALEIVYSHPPTLIISDILMPVMDGFEFCRILKENPEFRKIPVVLLTSLSESDDIIKGLECGADNFVLKPYEDEYLVTRVKSLLTNLTLRNIEKIQVAIDLYFGGKYYTINSDKRQILDLLISTFENAVQQNRELQKKQWEIGHLNEELEQKVEELSKLNKNLEQEIEEKKAAELNLSKRSEELDRANQKLKQFAYAVSHDLQEPLRMISSYAQLINKRHKDKLEGESADFMNFIIDGSVRMKVLINDILDYSKIGSVNIPLQKIDCNIVIAQVLDNLKMSIDDNQAVINFQKLPEVTADFAQLIQLFQNLIGNAIKFRKQEKPVISIESFVELDKAHFKISDNGIGIEEKDLDKIFEIFQRLHTRTEYQGTGVGLAVCKKIVETYGGEISVESKKDIGTSFYFSLPV